MSLSPSLPCPPVDHLPRLDAAEEEATPTNQQQRADLLDLLALSALKRVPSASMCSVLGPGSALLLLLCCGGWQAPAAAGPLAFLVGAPLTTLLVVLLLRAGLHRAPRKPQQAQRPGQHDPESKAWPPEWSVRATRLTPAVPAPEPSQQDSCDTVLDRIIRAGQAGIPTPPHGVVLAVLLLGAGLAQADNAPKAPPPKSEKEDKKKEDKKPDKDEAPNKAGSYCNSHQYDPECRPRSERPGLLSLSRPGAIRLLRVALSSPEAMTCAVYQDSTAALLCVGRAQLDQHHAAAALRLAGLALGQHGTSAGHLLRADALRALGRCAQASEEYGLVLQAHVSQDSALAHEGLQACGLEVAHA